MVDEGILNRFSMYRQASPALQREMAARAKPLHIEEQVLLVREGSVCADFALVACGRLRVFKRAETGREITLYHVGDGETCLVNMLCVFADVPSPASAVAETACDVLTVPAQVFRDWVAQHDVVRDHVFSTMAARFTDLMTLVEEITFRKMDQRLADLLLKRFMSRGLPLRVVSTTHEEIAAELGSAREVVSRLLKEFERLGAIQTARGRIELCDAARLEQIVGLPPRQLLP